MVLDRIFDPFFTTKEAGKGIAGSALSTGDRHREKSRGLRDRGQLGRQGQLLSGLSAGSLP